MEAGNACVKMRNTISDFREVMLPPPDDYDVEELCVQDVAEDPGPGRANLGTGSQFLSF